VRVSHTPPTKPFVGFLPPYTPNLLRYTHLGTETRKITPWKPRVVHTRRHRGGALREWKASVEYSTADLLTDMVCWPD